MHYGYDDAVSDTWFIRGNGYDLKRWKILLKALATRFPYVGATWETTTEGTSFQAIVRLEHSENGQTVHARFPYQTYCKVVVDPTPICNRLRSSGVDFIEFDNTTPACKIL